MSILIKGMDMPTSCWDCYFQDCGNCRLNAHKVVDKCIIEDRRDEACPLAPVPPHYDLIDHNALKIAVMNCDCETRVDFLKHAMDCINKAPVVIPSDMPTYEAEEGE
jgi:hypothetical protein